MRLYLMAAFYSSWGAMEFCEAAQDLLSEYSFTTVSVLLCWALLVLGNFFKGLELGEGFELK